MLSQLGVTKQPGGWLQETVVDTQEIVKDEIWSVTIACPCRDRGFLTTSKQTFYVLDSTCEVIGNPPASVHDNQGSLSSNKLPLRLDWSNYVQDRLYSPMPPVPQSSLIDRLKWTNREEYYHGISKLWLRRAKSEGAVGDVKRMIAYRYVMACVAGNR